MTDLYGVVVKTGVRLPVYFSVPIRVVVVSLLYMRRVTGPSSLTYKLPIIMFYGIQII